MSYGNGLYAASEDFCFESGIGESEGEYGGGERGELDPECDGESVVDPKEHDEDGNGAKDFDERDGDGFDDFE